MEAWVLFTLFAALMQSVRTAGQKRLTTHLSPMSATTVRYVFGMPFAALYFYAVAETPEKIVANGLASASFMAYAALAGTAQILATYCLIKTLSSRNFAVGTVLSKTEAIQTAIIGSIFFGAVFTLPVWLAVLVGALGVVLLGTTHSVRSLDWASVSYGLLSGLGFALTALWLRQASLSLPFSSIQNAAATLVFTVILQSALCMIYMLCKERSQFAILRSKLPIAVFIGATSAAGSVGWYTAVAYQEAALVRSVGQIELLFALVITHWFFGEKITGRELLGVMAIGISVIAILVIA